MIIGKSDFDFKSRTYIMGILNVTPDSFSDGNRFNSLDTAMHHTEKMLSEGADIIDVGGESTKPGHVLISEEEEINRVIPIIKAIKSNFPGIPISVDTYKPAILLAAIDSGADMANDIWGLKYDRRYAEILAESGIPCCIMHNRNNTDYRNILEDIVSDINESLNIAFSCSIKKEKIILDPGIGFGKTYEQNLFVMNNLDKIIKEFPYPFLLGISRKSMIGYATDEPNPEKRLEGTIAANVLGISKGCGIIRVHDVKSNRLAAVMADKILKSI
ncbi:MAG: dihydropteroate synthase [Lachnospiraceae bacterium]|nr:dihydropteroate synthase [Lachnospiraceae bacterium]